MKVLFVLQSIGYGGSMTSMINLLSLLKEEKILDIDVLLMDPNGELYEELYKHVNILKTDRVLEATSVPRKKLVKNRKIGLLLTRVFVFLLGKFHKTSTSRQGYKISSQKYADKYDCVIAYQESVATDYARYIKTGKRIAWVHNDFDNVLNIYGSLDRLQNVYSSFDKIVCVSKAGANNFKNKSGIETSRISYIYNPLICEELRKKAEDEIPYQLIEDNKLSKALQTKEIKLISSGRFAKQKRFDRVIDAAEILKDKGYSFKWFILGDGELFIETVAEIKKRELDNYVFLTGGLKNPFPVVRNCDVFVLTSDFEAHPMVANEALILGKPVISTNFESASEVVTDGVNGLICEMSSRSIADSIETLLKNRQFYLELKSNAKKFDYNNNTIIKQVLDVIQN